MPNLAFSDLVARFGANTVLPIKISDVRYYLLDRKIQDVIEIFEVEMDTAIARGHFTQFTNHKTVYGNPNFHTYITVAKNQSDCWKRFVACKEMIHLFDKDGTKTKTKEDIDQLAAELAAGYPGTTSASNNADRVAMYKALAVLAPIDVVNKIRPAFENDLLANLTIAQFFRIPEVWVETLFSKRYQELYQRMLDG